MKHCFETCEEPSCNAGAPCKKLKRRVRAGEAQPSEWMEIEPEPELPIDMAEPDPAQAGAEPAPSAVVCGKCDGTGLDPRYCNYQCDKCDGSGHAGAEPVATWINKYGMREWEVHALRAGWAPAHNTPPALVQLTDDEIRAAYESVYIYRAVMGHGSFSFARAVIAAYEAKNGIGGDQK